MSVMEEQPIRKLKRSFTREFKRDAVSMVLSDERTIVDVAGSLGLGESTLGKWVSQARIDLGDKPGLTTSEREELTRLRREVNQLRMERELLKRATAFWVKESGQ